MQVIIGSSDGLQIQRKAYLVVSDVLFLNLWIISKRSYYRAKWYKNKNRFILL